MPELPEVETIRRQLAPLITGRAIEDVTIDDPRWCAPLDKGEFTVAVSGREIQAVRRRGKYLLFDLGDVALLLHLRMTGNLLYQPRPDSARRAHRRGALLLTGGGLLEFVDPRRFGTATLVAAGRLDDHLDARLGVEPFDEAFTPDLLHSLTRGKKTSAKAFLLDQRRLAGVGNIYADEALFRAGIDPRRPAGRLTRAQCARLHLAVRTALTAGIESAGASIGDFRDVHGKRGGFQEQFMVHRRGGKPCPTCGEAIVKLRVAGRGTYVCRGCQRR